MKEQDSNDKKIVNISYEIVVKLDTNKRNEIDEVYREYLESNERVQNNKKKINELKKNFSTSNNFNYYR